MTTTPGGSRSAVMGEWSPALTDETVEHLGGGVYLAGAEGSVSGAVTVTAAFSARVARRRARARAAALDALYGLPDRWDGVETPVGRRLSLADFMPEPPASVTATLIPGAGLLSGDAYLLPAEVVKIDVDDGRVEPTLVGVVEEDASGAIADLLANDVLIRWWESPRIPLLRVTAHLDGLLPPGVLPAAHLLGLRVTAFVLRRADFRIGLIGVSGGGTTVGVAAGRTVRTAIGEAFLRAIAARAQPWSTLPTADSLRRLTVWHREADYLDYLERAAVDADPATLDDPLGSVFSWPDIACRRFGHEPIAVGAGAGPVKVVCPGAACYRTAPSGFMLPCPVP